MSLSRCALLTSTAAYPSSHGHRTDHRQGSESVPGHRPPAATESNMLFAKYGTSRLKTRWLT